MADEELSIEVTDAPSEADDAAVLAGMRAFNEPFLGPADFAGLATLVRDRGVLIGGLIGKSGRGFLFIELLWVDETRRRSGLGARLLAAAEAEARRRGCRVVWLDTYGFQARPFYERQGYTVFGELDGLPNGYRRYFLSKRLEGSAGDP